MTTHLTTAVLIALDLDQSKQFFGHRDDAARLEFVKSLASANSLNVGKTWRALEEVLSDNKHEPDGVPSPLSLCLSGGRPMQKSGPEIVSLLRPDMVPVVAEALQSLNSSAIQERYAKLDQPLAATVSVEDVKNSLEELSSFYRHAADERSAVVFAAW